jgi:hypothetical protein
VNIFNASMLKLATIAGLDNVLDFGWNGTYWQYPFGTKRDSSGLGPQPMGGATGVLNAGAINPIYPASGGLCSANGINGSLLNIVEAGEYLLEINYNGNFTSGHPVFTITTAVGTVVSSADAGSGGVGVWFGTATGSALLCNLVVQVGQALCAGTLSNWINISSAGASTYTIGGIIVRLIRVFSTMAQAINSVPIVNAKREILPPPAPTAFVVSGDPKTSGPRPLTVALVNSLCINHPRAKEIRDQMLAQCTADPLDKPRIARVERIPCSGCPRCCVVIMQFDDGSVAEPQIVRCAECIDSSAPPPVWPPTSRTHTLGALTCTTASAAPAPTAHP